MRICNFTLLFVDVHGTFLSLYTPCWRSTFLQTSLDVTHFQQCHFLLAYIGYTQLSDNKVSQFFSGENKFRTCGRIIFYDSLANCWFQPLTHLSLVASIGLEPINAAPKTVVLPLHQEAIQTLSVMKQLQRSL